MNADYKFPDIINENYDAIFSDWIKEQITALTFRRELIKEEELKRQCQDFLTALIKTIQDGNIEQIDGEEWRDVRSIIDDVSRRRIELGFISSETATFIFSLKQSIFSILLENALDWDNSKIIREIWGVTILMDKLGLYSFESYQKTRERIIMRQQQDLIELSTPVVQIWDGILAVPLIGTLDSGRTQVFMETLLEQIAETESEIAIIDITGVAAVDTLVAQHLLKTVAATRLMGADCIISGIKPEIAQTIIQLGVDLTNVSTKATLSGALKLAMKKMNLKVEKLVEKSGAESSEMRSNPL